MLVDLLPKSDIIADIGTDHAYLPIYLISSGQIKYALACDIRLGPLQAAVKNIRKYGLEDCIELLHGPGLVPLNGRICDTIVIAGMGGLMIRQILEEGSEYVKAVKNIILQPMDHHPELRKFLHENGYLVLDEVTIDEGHLTYLGILCTYGEGETESIEELQYLTGWVLGKKGGEDAIRYYNRLIKKVSKKAIALKLKSKPDIDEINYWENILEYLKNTLTETEERK
jgi:tRNA (adenine22-N1)-methyltransferase